MASTEPGWLEAIMALNPEVDLELLPKKWHQENFGDGVDYEAGPDVDGYWIVAPCPLQPVKVREPEHAAQVHFAKGIIRCLTCCAPKRAMSMQNAARLLGSQ